MVNRTRAESGGYSKHDIITWWILSRFTKWYLVQPSICHIKSWPQRQEEYIFFRNVTHHQIATTDRPLFCFIFREVFFHFISSELLEPVLWPRSGFRVKTTQQQQQQHNNDDTHIQPTEGYHKTWWRIDAIDAAEIEIATRGTRWGNRWWPAHPPPSRCAMGSFDATTSQTNNNTGTTRCRGFRHTRCRSHSLLHPGC